MWFKQLKRGTLSKTLAFVKVEYILFDNKYGERIHYIVLQISSSAEQGISWRQSAIKQQKVCKERGVFSTWYCEVMQPCCFPSYHWTVDTFVLPSSSSSSSSRIRAVSKHLYIHLCAITRLNIVIVLIYWTYIHIHFCVISGLHKSCMVTK